MRKLPQILGIVIGLCAAVIVISAISGKQNASMSAAPVMSECDGALKELIIHYVRGADAVLPIYQQFLPLLSSDVTVHAVCSEQADFEELRDALPKLACKLDSILTHHEITAWSRDRWVALPATTAGEPATLLAPRGENSAASWPARAGDQQVGFDIARAFPSRLTALRSELNFDAGDFLSDGGTVFVTSSVLHRNLNQTVGSRDELVNLLHRELHAKIVLMDQSPDHHAAMFMTVAAGRTMLIADPKLARELLPADSPILATLPGGPDFSAETQHQLDAIAQQCRSLGYKVVRIPTLPAMDRKTYLTYVNVLSEMRDGKRIVYMPVFQGVEALNDAAEKTWRDIGYEVHRIDCTSTYRLFGNLHCLVNVLHREGEARVENFFEGFEKSFRATSAHLKLRLIKTRPLRLTDSRITDARKSCSDKPKAAFKQAQETFAPPSIAHPACSAREGATWAVLDRTYEKGGIADESCRQASACRWLLRASLPWAARVSRD